MEAYRSSLDKDTPWSPDVAAHIIYEWFDAAGTWFVREDTVFLSYQGRVIRLATDLPMKALLYHEAGINYAHRSSRAVWEALAASFYAGSTCLHTPGDTKQPPA